MTTEEVYKFLKNQNRPFSANDILQSIGKDHGKTAVQKSLDKLVKQQQIIEKVYGKQKIYCVVQEQNVDPEKFQEELLAIDREINDISNELGPVEEKLQASLSQVKSLQNKMTTEEARTQKRNLEIAVKEMKARLKELEETSKPISEEEKQKIVKEYNLCEKEYKKRKRMCMDIIDAIMEGYPKTKKQLMEEIGIETDEEVGFTLN